MTVTITTEQQRTHITLEGRLDTVSSEQFEIEVSQVMQQEHPDITIDCTAFDYISSSGLRQFLLLQKGTMAKQGKLVIQHMKPEIKEVFDMTGLSSIFTIE